MQAGSLTHEPYHNVTLTTADAAIAATHSLCYLDQVKSSVLSSSTESTHHTRDCLSLLPGPSSTHTHTMPYRDCAAKVRHDGSEPHAYIDRGIINSVAAEDDDCAVDLDKRAEQFYDGLSDKQKRVVAAKQRTEDYLARITHADTKSEQVGRMDRSVMNGSVFANAAQLHVVEEGYDTVEDGTDGDQDEERDDEASQQRETDENRGADGSDGQEKAAQVEENSRESYRDRNAAAATQHDDEADENAAHTTQKVNGEPHNRRKQHSAAS